MFVCVCFGSVLVCVIWFMNLAAELLFNFNPFYAKVFTIIACLLLCSCCYCYCCVFGNCFVRVDLSLTVPFLSSAICKILPESCLEQSLHPSRRCRLASRLNFGALVS